MSLLPDRDKVLLDKLVFYILFLLITFSAIVVFNILNISLPISVTTSTQTSELAVVGEGKVDVVPDTVFIDVGISASNLATAEAAQKAIDSVNNKIIAAMQKLGIPQTDIKTSNYSVTPAYSYDQTSGNKITGYNGNATLEIKIKDMKLTTQVINEATAAGANQIQDTRFSVDDPQKFRDQARDTAIANARAQAAKLSQTLGIRLGRIVNLVESTPNTVYPMEARAMAAPGLGGGGPQIEPGTQTVTSTVTLYFEKK